MAVLPTDRSTRAPLATPRPAFPRSQVKSQRLSARLTLQCVLGACQAYANPCSGGGTTAIAVDQAGNAYVTGWTSSTNFPTANAFQPASGGQLDAFIAKIVDLPAPAPNLPQNSVVNGASFRLATDPNSSIAAGSIVAIFGSDLAAATQPAASVPLPTTLMDHQRDIQQNSRAPVLRVEGAGQCPGAF